MPDGHFLDPLTRNPRHPHVLRSVGTQRVVAATLIAAFDSATRNQGLLKHRSLPAGHAMIIAPCSAVHTFFMKFPIDLIFVAKDGRVLKTRRHVPAWRISGRLGAFAVIELAAGALADGQCEIGDRLEVVAVAPAAEK